MFLKSLTLKGFKSFAEAATLEFEPGVTVVVGPNGSGKSNIVDAVAWVLGAQGPRTVRSSKMDDVIFAGSAKRPALGRAEVSLTIDNSAGVLPIEFTEVTVTRTLFRASGESEYALNGVPCRLLDIQELLSDTGVGRSQHVIVSQGNLDAILNARPEERRLVVEEAAGILKHRRRKEKAERRLEAAEANLVRLTDLLREVRRQLRPLERQAEAARRHDQVVTELASLRLHLAGRELSSLRARGEANVERRADLARLESDLRAELGRLDAEVLSEQAAVSGSSSTHTAELLARHESLRERARGLGALLAERRRSAERDRGTLLARDVVATLEAEAARVTAQLTEVEAEARALLPRGAELAEAEAGLTAQRAAFDRDWGGPEGAGQQLGLMRGEAAEVRGELAALRSSVERAGREGSRLEARLSALAEKEQRLAAEAQYHDQEMGAAKSCEPTLCASVDEAVTRRADAERAARAADAALRAAESEHHSWSARAHALAVALQEVRARSGAERLGEVEGVLGSLLDVVDVDEGWEPAFEAAAGEALAAAIVDSPKAARKALAVVREGGSSGAVLALGVPASGNGGAEVVESAHGPKVDSGPTGLGEGPAQAVEPWAEVREEGARKVLEVLGELAGVEPVRAHVRSRSGPEVEALLERLLSSAVAVEGSWERALDTALAHPGVVAVTRDGDRFATTAWRVGSVSSGVTGAALEEAECRAQEATASFQDASDQARNARRELSSARAVETERIQALEDNRQRLLRANDRLARLEAEREHVAGESETLRAHLAELGERLRREQGRVGELESLLPALESEEAALVAQANSARSARARLEERTSAVAALRRDLEVRAASLEERRSMLSRRLEELEARLERDRSERALAEARRQELELLLVRTERLAALVADRLSMIEAGVIGLRERRRLESEAARAAGERLDVLRRARAGAERRLEEVREHCRRAELEEAELRMRLEAATEALRRELDCEPDAAMAAECPELPPGTSAPNRVRELEREARLLGPINPLAVEEFAALQERHEFLSGQVDDVKATRRDLSKVIRAVDGEIVTVFRAAFADVADNYAALFDTLFPGGKGRLRLTDPENLLETGIELEARPPGKTVRKLSLLSGGERSLTALAFLFAVFRARPSPFYLMDEVEAALDDVNLHRFLGLVHEFREEAQLLIVSHQKRTMEAADCLYGVTMQPGGSTRVISERVAARG